MAIDKADWLRAKGPTVGDGLDPRMKQAIAAEAVRAESMVGHEGWDTFLTYVEAAITEAKNIKMAAQEKFEKSAIVNHDQLLAIKMVLAEANAVQQALEQVVKLPYKIIHDHADETDRKIPVPKMPDFLTKE